MYKVNEDVYVRATDDLNFVVSKKNGVDKLGNAIFINIAYFNSLYFVNEYCMSVYNKDLFNDLTSVFSNSIDTLTNENKNIYFLNQFNIEDLGEKDILSCELEISDLSRCYKIFYNDSLIGYYPKLHQCWKRLLTVYVLRMFNKNIELNKIEKEIKSIVYALC